MASPISIAAQLQQAKDLERQRIAAQLHDDVNGHLLGLKMTLASIQYRLAQPETFDPVWLAEQINYLETLTLRSLESTERVIHQLDPPILVLGIVAALKWQSQEFTRQAGIRCHFHTNADPIDLSATQAYAVFFICQEALNNVGKHAKASHAKIQVDADANGVWIKISDDGIGLPMQVIPGSGLRSMQERAAAIGARLTPGHGLGTAWILHLPVNMLSFTGT